mmetsp:Transcript_16716/g.23620  ORF Transcript_16716/g.23620 Transcript_16716/m.23620 type:complete len:251 (+) Transcript_16716:338-1090(+)
MLALKPHCSHFGLVAKHCYCWNTSAAAAEPFAAVGSTDLAGPSPFAEAAPAAAYHRVSFVPGEVLAFVVPSALACLDDEAVAGEEVVGAFLAPHPFRKKHSHSYSNRDARSCALNHDHDDAEIDLWNDFDYGGACIQNWYFCYDCCCNFDSSTCGVCGVYLYHHFSRICCSFYRRHHGVDSFCPCHLFRSEKYCRIFRNEKNVDRQVQHHDVVHTSYLAFDQIADFASFCFHLPSVDFVSPHACNDSRCP